MSASDILFELRNLAHVQRPLCSCGACAQLDEANYIIVGRTLALPCDDDAERAHLPSPTPTSASLSTNCSLLLPALIDECAVWYINYNSPSNASTQYEI